MSKGTLRCMWLWKMTKKETAFFFVQLDPIVSYFLNKEGKSSFYMATKSKNLEIVKHITTEYPGRLDSCYHSKIAEQKFVAIQDDFEEKGTLMDLFDDVSALLDTLNISKAFLVGKDFRALPAYLVAVLHPSKVSGVVTLGIPFMLPGPDALQAHLLPKGFYITRWQEPGRAEADFGRLDVKTMIKNIYTLVSSAEVPVAGDDQEIMDLVVPSTPLPQGFSEEDLEVYASLYENSGFRFPLQVPYSSSLADHGEEGLCPKVAGHGGLLTKWPSEVFVTDLDIIFIEEGNHFIQEQLPEQVNELIIKFHNNHSN